jgi:hypothetical protein
MGNPVSQPQACSTPFALSPGPSARPVKRVSAFKSSTEARGAQIGSEGIERSHSEAGLADGSSRHARAQCRQQDRQILVVTADHLVDAGVPHRAVSRAQPNDAACCRLVGLRRGGRHEQALRQLRPGFHQAGADQQHDVGPEPRLVRRRDHHAGLAHDREIAQNSRGILVVDGGAEPLRQPDRRARSSDIGPQACDHRCATCFEQSRRLGKRGVQRHGSAVDPGVAHLRLPHTGRCRRRGFSRRT